MSMNALLIEQEAADAKLAFAVHQNSSLRHIRLVRAKIASTLRPETFNTPLEIDFQFKSKQLETGPEVLRLLVLFRMTGKIRESESPLVSVESDYEADYQLGEGFALTPEAARAFKDGNAIFNMWPYFREYLQSSLQRMGLPPLTAPFLRLQPKTPKRAGKDTPPLKPSATERVPD